MLGIVITLGAATALTLLSAYIENRKSLYGKKGDLRILIIRFLHYSFVIFNIFYIFLFDTTLDILYLLLSMGMYIHWLFLNNECILDYLEKKYYIADYVPGTNINNIYVEVLFGNYTRTVITIMGLLSTICFITVLFRQTYLPLLWKVSITLIFITYIYVISIMKVTIVKMDYSLRNTSPA